MISARRCEIFAGIRLSLRHPASRSANPSRRSISRKASNPPSEDRRPPSNRATTVLPCTGDRPGRNGVASTMAGAAPVDPRVQALNPNPTPNQHLVLRPPTLMHNACWLAGQLWHEQLDRFWAERLPPSRKGTRWDQILQVLA